VSGETRSGNGTEVVDDVVKREQVDSIKRMDSNGEQTRLGRERADKDRKDFGSTTANNNRIAMMKEWTSHKTDPGRCLLEKPGGCGRHFSL
jgi:hypothetical protein